MSGKKNSKLQVVTIDNFYDSVEVPGAGPTFVDVVALRASGFGPEYPASFLPLDRVDFFSRHQVLGRVPRMVETFEGLPRGSIG